jgi:GNAT superfamily N-acetyltransferase
MPSVWENGGYTIQHENNSHGLTISAHDRSGKIVGRAKFFKGETYIEADDTDGENAVFVDEGHRRKGLANGMYDLAERVSGMKIIPSEQQSGTGTYFWQSRIQKLPEDHPAHEWF